MIPRSVFNALSFQRVDKNIGCALLSVVLLSACQGSGFKPVSYADNKTSSVAVMKLESIDAQTTGIQCNYELQTEVEILSVTVTSNECPRLIEYDFGTFSWSAADNVLTP